MMITYVEKHLLERTVVLTLACGHEVTIDSAQLKRFSLNELLYIEVGSAVIGRAFHASCLG